MTSRFSRTPLSKLLAAVHSSKTTSSLPNELKLQTAAPKTLKTMLGLSRNAKEELFFVRTTHDQPSVSEQKIEWTKKIRLVLC